MGKFSRDKGQRGEREVAGMLNEVVQEVWQRNGWKMEERPVFGRNLLQTQNGGHDLDGVDWMAVEVKRHETEQVATWWKQAVAQAQGHEATLRKRGLRLTVQPVLVWRKNNCKWQVKMVGQIPLSDGKKVSTYIVVTITAFLAWFRRELEVRYSVD